MPTKNHSSDEIKNEMTRKACSNSFYVSTVSDNKDGTSAHPIFRFSYIGMDDDHKAVLDLSSDIHLNANLDNNYDDYIRNAISTEKQMYEYLCANPSYMASIRSMAYDNLYNRYQSYLLGIDYNNFIIKLEKEYNENPQKVMDKIKSVRDKAFSKKNLTVLFSGNDESKNKFNNELESFINKFNDNSYEKASYDLPVPARREALTTNMDVQYMSVNSSLKNLNLTGEGKFYVLSKLLYE